MEAAAGAAAVDAEGATRFTATAVATARAEAAGGAATAIVEPEADPLGVSLPIFGVPFLARRRERWWTPPVG